MVYKKLKKKSLAQKLDTKIVRKYKDRLKISVKIHARRSNGPPNNLFFKICGLLLI